MFRRRRIRSRRIRQARKERLLGSTLLWTAVVLASLLLLVQVSMLPHLQIENVDILGTQATSKQALFEVVSKELSGKYFYLFPRNNIVIYPDSSIEESLLKQFPRLKTVKASREGFHDISVDVTEREMVGIVCSESIDNEVVSEVCHFVDEEGFIYAPAPTFSGNSFFRYYDAGKIRFNIGTHFLPAEDFAQVFQLQEALEQLGVSVTMLTVNMDGDSFAQHFTFALSEGTEIIFSAEPEELEMQLQNLQTVLESDEFAEESGGDIGTVEYIDLRFGNKVFYRLEGGEE